MSARSEREHFFAVYRAAEEDGATPDAIDAWEKLRSERTAAFDEHVAKVFARCPTEEKLKAACRARFAELRPDLAPIWLLGEVRSAVDRLQAAGKIAKQRSLW